MGGEKKKKGFCLDNGGSLRLIIMPLFNGLEGIRTWQSLALSCLNSSAYFVQHHVIVQTRHGSRLFYKELPLLSNLFHLQHFLHHQKVNSIKQVISLGPLCQVWWRSENISINLLLPTVSQSHICSPVFFYLKGCQVWGFCMIVFLETAKILIRNNAMEHCFAIVFKNK